jgi:hypothetical protein
MSICDKIDAYHGKIAGGVPWRYRSWEHCFGFFRRITPAGIAAQRDAAALQLGFYLASWGMYRASSFLLQYDYTVHLPVVDRLSDPCFSPLWERDVGSRKDDVELVPLILSAIEAVRESYSPWGEATDTLVTKVLLGTLGCVPACDRFFIDGFRSSRLEYSYLNRKFVHRVIEFCRENLNELKTEQAQIKSISGSYYPLMKLVDMYFWEIGHERS